MQGTLFLIVGPSGVGKDTLLDGARDKLASSAWFSFPRRVITRPADAGGEDHIPATEEEFANQSANGEFWHQWKAHGLSYGIPISIKDDLNRGINVVLNTSRNELDAYQKKADNVVIIYISASPSIVEQRLRQRGRESEDEIGKRLGRLVEHSALSSDALEILNDSTRIEGIETLVDLITGTCRLQATVRQFPVEIGEKQICLVHQENQIARRLLAGSVRVALSNQDKTITAELGRTDSEDMVLKDQCALSKAAMNALGVTDGDTVTVARSPNPKSRSILQKKVRGGELTNSDMEAFIHDLVKGRFSEAEIAGFLVAASKNLSIDEVISLTRVRANFAHRQVWEQTVVVDKHSMGGVPGNRITPIIIPILAAHGLTIPKTSSRAITSAAGTSDVMEVLARVDLTPNAMKRVVEKSNACMAWNGRLTQSPVDNVMNAINRPLGLSSTLLDVSSIMSKKLAAGSSHVLIDLPVGPKAKTKTREEAAELQSLFESVGRGIGLETRVNISDGTRPVGRGVGPVLELLDVLAILKGEKDSPSDLRDKSIEYAAHLMEWVGAVSEGQGRQVAKNIISTGRALEKLMEIAELQGRNTDQTMQPGQFIENVLADRSGTIEEINIQSVSEIARSAGAPLDKTAGITLLAEVGQNVAAGETLIRIHSSSADGAKEAIRIAGDRRIFDWCS